MSEINKEVENQDQMVEEITDKLQQKVDIRLAKMVDRLIKQTGVAKEKLKDKTLEEQYDLLEFLADNSPKPADKKTKNEPVIPLPTNASDPTIGKRVKDVEGEYWLFKPHEWLKSKEK
jgi:hypothetical protein